MQQYLILILALLVSTATYLHFQKQENSSEQDLEQIIFKKRVEDFTNFKKVNDKHYDSQEESYRLSVFIQNEEKIEKFNEKSKGQTVLAVNEFSDLTEDEFASTHLGMKIDLSEIEEEFTHPILQQAYEEDKQNIKLQQTKGVDYTHLNNGFMRHQICGDCWANAAATITEMHFSKIQLSVQDLINCDTYADGCSGSTSIHNNLFHIIQEGVFANNQIQYYGKDLVCHSNTKYEKFFPPAETKLVSYAQFFNPDCEKLKYLIRVYGPASVTLYAEQSVHWSSYESGILSHEDDEDWILHEKGFYNINHAVALVGYTEDYWIIQNSWGSKWGENGYARLKMGNTFNICVNAATYVHESKTKTKSEEPEKAHYMEYKFKN